MPESIAIKRIDDSLGHIGDQLGRRPAPDEKLLGPTRELALGFRWIALQLIRGKHLNEPSVKKDSGSERGCVERVTADPREHALAHS